ncbi:hypothetical protein Pelo_19809 [Pelomyxa schiedti]|nr:hypothetical protein Pelo_19809 [Pelomyxa schiedti]
MRLGTMYTKGTSATPQNFTLALKHFQAAVEQGNPQAAFAVAQLILFGYVPGATTREAVELLHKACTPSIPDEAPSPYVIGHVTQLGGRYYNVTLLNQCIVLGSQLHVYSLGLPIQPLLDDAKEYSQTGSL